MKSKTERLENDMESNILEFECVGLNDGGKFPIENTGRGQDISPEFIIRNLNTNAVTLMITLEDLSHPIKGFTHWIIWNIPATDKIIKAILVRFSFRRFRSCITMKAIPNSLYRTL